MTQDHAPRVELIGLAAYLADQPDVDAAYLFGSVARGQANQLSDVDVAVLLTPGINAEAAAERQVALMVALNRFSDREIQVTLLNAAPPLLAYEIVREGRLLCERDPLARIGFEVRSMKFYFDLQPAFRTYDRELAKRIREVGLGTRRQRRSSSLDAAQRLRERLAGAAER